MQVGAEDQREADSEASRRRSVWFRRTGGDEMW